MCQSVELPISLRRITLAQRRAVGFAGESWPRIPAISRCWRSRFGPWAPLAAA
jgi:hypothetical protein